MSEMARWQKVVYYLGEALIIGGLLWGLYDRFVLGVCPINVFSFKTLIVLGLGVSVAPVHPFGKRQYMVPLLERSFALALLVWAVSLLGVAYSIWNLAILQPGLLWAYALIPAALFFWFAVSTRTDKSRRYPKQAPPPSKKNK